MDGEVKAGGCNKKTEREGNWEWSAVKEGVAAGSGSQQH